MTTHSDSQVVIDEWCGKLVGKVLSEEHGPDTFKRADLPSGFRVLKAGIKHTQDYNPSRVSVHCDQNMKVYRLSIG